MSQGATSEHARANADPSAALAAASQFIADGLHHGKAAAADRQANIQDGIPTDESLAHTFNRLLVAGVIEPLISSPSSCQDAEAQPAPGSGLGIGQALETLSHTLSTSPKYLEHLFEFVEGASSSASTSAITLDMTNTTFDVWATPRLLCAAASLLSESRSTRAIKQPHYAQQCTRLSLQLMDHLQKLLSTSIEAVGQIDNVRLILAHSLRTSVHALACTGYTSFNSYALLPDFVVPSTEHQMLPQRLSRSSPPSVTFFDSALPDPSFRLTSRKGRPKPTGKRLAPLAALQMEAALPFPLAVNIVSTTSDAVFASSVFDRAGALFLSSINLCLRLAENFPAYLLDLADSAVLLFVEHLQHRWTCVKQKDACPGLQMPLAAHAYSTIANHAGFLAECYSSSLLKSLQVAAEHMSSLADFLDHLGADEKACFELRHTFNSLGACFIACALDTSESRQTELAVTLRPYLTQLTNQMRLTAAQSASEASESLNLSARVCYISALVFLIAASGRHCECATVEELDAQMSMLVQSAAGGVQGHQCSHLANPHQRLGQLHRLLQAIRSDAAHKQQSSTSTLSLLKGLRKRKLRESDGSSNAVDVLDTLLRLDPSFQAPDRAAAYGDELARRHLIARSCHHIVIPGDTKNADADQGNCFCDAICLVERAAQDNIRSSAKIRRLNSATTATLWKEVHSGIKASRLVSSRTIDMLRRCVSHSPLSAPLPYNGDKNVMNILSHSLRSNSRSARLAGNELALAYQTRLLQQRDASTEQEWMTRFEQIPRIYQDILGDSTNFFCHETALIGLAGLFDLPVEGCQETCLLSLVLHLGHSNPFVKACAYKQIVQIAAAHRCTTFQLVQKHFEKVSTSIVERFISMPDLWTSFLSLIKMNQATFFNLTKEFTLPHLITMICSGPGTAEVGTKMIELIARALGTDVPRLCHDNITPIFRSFFMRSATLRDLGLSTLVQLIGVDAASLKALLRSRQSDVVGYLVVKLGNRATRMEAYAGLEFIIETFNGTSATARSKDASARKAKVAAFLTAEILAILTWINQELSGEHGRRTATELAFALRSIGALVEIIGPPISAVTPQIMATLNSHLQPDSLSLATLESWKIFITTLRFDDIGPFVGQTAAALLSAWDLFNDEKKKIVISILHYLIVENAAYLKDFIDDIPSLDRLDEEIPEVCRGLRGVRETWNNDRRFRNILDRTAHENTSICNESLRELEAFLSGERAYIEALTSGDSFNSLIGQCIRTLMHVAARSDAPQTDIRDLCFRCFGLIGAVDPDRIEHAVEEPLKILLSNFEDQEEAIDFSLHLIQDLLVPAFRAATDTTQQNGLAYAIQELLKVAGFNSSILTTGPNARPVGIKTRQRLADLPQDVIDTITPLLDSRYGAQVGKPSIRETPIYMHSRSYSDWLQGWTSRLITKTVDRHNMSAAAIAATGTAAARSAAGVASTIFGVFRVAIRSHDIGIARHLLPHLVLHSIISGDAMDREQIVDEIQTVLRDQVESQTNYEAERKLLTAQTLFTIMDHVGVWMRRKRQDLARTSRRPRAALGGEEVLAGVEMIMRRISQELLAQASLQCKAYSRALLNFELRARTMRSEGKDDHDLQTYYENMHRIYAHLDEPDGMEGISTRVISPSLEHQIREHESTGRWTSAQSCWEVELQQRPDDPELHLGLLRCLRNLGHYDTMRTHIRGALSAHPEWEDLLDAFRVEGACILGDWDEVEARTKRSEAKSPEHSIGRALLAMRQNDSDLFGRVLVQARQDLGMPLVAAGKASYPAVYGSVLHLHMLQELEMIRSHASKHAGDHIGALTRANASETVSDLNRSLAARLNATLPSFRTQEPVLSLRRTAFAALASCMNAGNDVGEAWIATAKIARRAGHMQTAYSATLQATQNQATFAFVQRVKLLAKEEQTHAAIRDLVNSLNTLVGNFKPNPLADPKKEKPAFIELQQNDAEGRPMRIDRETFAKACLLRARLQDSTFRYTASEILDRYKEAAKEQNDSEKMWYHLGHFQDTHEGLLPNMTMQRYNVCRAFLRSAQLGTKFFYRTLPRVLTIWMDLAADDQILGHSKKSNNGDRELAQQASTFSELNALMRKYSRRLKPFQWLAVFPQLVARIVQKNEDAWMVLQDMILQVLLAYPQQAMWSMVAGASSKDSERKRRYSEIIHRLGSRGASSHKEVVKVVSSSQRLAKELLRLCDYSVAKNETMLSMEKLFPGLLEVAHTSELLLPLQTSMTVLLPSNHLISDVHRPFACNLPTIATFEDTIEVMNSLQKPRKVMIVGNDGNRYPFLCKPKDDLRKDARLMEFDSMINKLLQSQPESRKRKLYVRTYAVLILNEEHGLIEWVPHTVGFRHILTKLYSARGMQIYTAEVKTNMDEARQSNDARTTEKVFQEKVLAKFRPVFHEWFLATFPDPTAWLQARSAYARTAAVMSIVGFVLGLGDRHGENILFDSNSGDTVHVDLNCLFDKGQRFEIPERVPFRLTQNMVDAMGVTGCDGVFRKSAEITMSILRDNRDSLMSVLEAMVHDPLGEWSVPEERHRSKNSGKKGDPRVVEARRALDPVANKLDGRIYKLGSRDPTPPYSTNNLVDALIKEATSPVNLAKMYIGWSSWL
ncbi:related to serine-protein kinase atr [Melanopsichium pennsylvanicum]|uniref:non-specific serine/threonine protein kinase n=2 Tax=Melanopsichium pennsylvanicum TaxID=63383 RepID=A0AAJ4XH82_9BASI|nr:related to serine-protein kinase atr [Melanopsichium pennsylvanicum 4]SNX82494.1 related to serine-protein kinase atr [Melanopsichium pennsylvanicum]